MTADLNAVKYFFDPHPGLASATVLIPAAVKRVADSLSGTHLLLSEAINKISAAVPGGLVSVTDKSIVLEIYDGKGLRHGFRVIRFRDYV